MKHLFVILVALLLACAMMAPALADETAQVSLDTNPSTGYEWVGFVIAGDAVELGDGVFVSDQTDAAMVGVGGQTVFELRAVKPGTALVKFTYLRMWEDDIAQERLFLADVDDALHLSCQDITSSGILSGVVVSVSEEECSAVVNTDTLGDIIVLFPADMALPVQDEHITVYTNGIMTMSLPAIVNAFAWDSLPVDYARVAIPVFGELTGFDAFVDSAGDILTAYYEDGTPVNAHFTTTDPQDIRKLLDAVSALQIASLSDTMVTDWYPMLQFADENGSVWTVHFDGHWLSVGRDNYVLENDAPFWKLINALLLSYGDDQ